MPEAGRLEEPSDIRSLLKKLSAGAQYRRMMAAHEEGQPICVASAGIPSEILYAMGVYPIYPESLAAIAAGIGKAQEFFDLARERGYSPSICSYARCGLAFSSRSSGGIHSRSFWYGPIFMMAGKRSTPLSGRKMSAYRIAPSRSGICTSFSTISR